MTHEQTIDGLVERTLGAEKAVLGAILIDGTRYHDAVAVLGADDWFRDAHRILWTGFQQLANSATNIDLVTLRGVLTPEEFARVGGAAYVASLTDGVPRSSNVTFYAQQVRDASVRRQVERAAREVVAEAEAGEATGDELLERLEHMAHAMRTQQAVTGCMSPDDRVSAAMRSMEEAPAARRGVPSGLQEIDAMTFGFRAGQLVVLGARPSQGKTALALQMAVEAGKLGPVLFCSLEMSTEQITARELSMRSGYAHAVLDAGHVAGLDLTRIGHAMQAMSDGNVHVYDRGGQTVGHIRGAARRLAQRVKRPPSMIVVDYLQLMRAEHGTRAENRTLEVMQFSMGLKQLAKDVQCPVVALSQLSRDSERRNDKRPILSDLRDSGSIEQDADIVMLLHRPGVADRNPHDARAEIIVAKQRNGPTGIAHLRFIPDTMSFRDAVGTEVYA